MTEVTDKKIFEHIKDGIHMDVKQINMIGVSKIKTERR